MSVTKTKQRQDVLGAEVWFLERLDLYKHTKPYMITFDTSDFPGEKANHSYSKHAVKMADARQTSSTLTVNRNGFEFRR